MDPISLNETFLAVVVWTGVTAFVVALCVLALTLLLRGRTVDADERDELLLANWRRYLEKALRDHAQEDLSLPSERYQRMLVLRLWLHIYSVASDTERIRLRAAAERTGLDHVALAEVDHETMEERTAAVQALGCMTRSHEDTTAWETLCLLSDTAEPRVALIAIQALLRIDPAAAASLVLERLASFQETRGEEVSRLLAAARPEARSALLMEARRVELESSIVHDLRPPNLQLEGVLKWRLLATIRN